MKALKYTILSYFLVPYNIWLSFIISYLWNCWKVINSETLNFVYVHKNSFWYHMWRGFFLCFLLFLPFCSYNILDPEIFSLNNSGTVLAREAADDNTAKPAPSLPEKSEETETQTCKNFYWCTTEISFNLSFSFSWFLTVLTSIISCSTSPLEKQSVMPRHRRHF